MAQITCKHLTFSYPTRPEQNVLNDVSFSIEKGEYIALCGTSGSGKTTLLRHLKTVLTPYGTRSGVIEFHDTELSEVDELTQATKIGYVMQNPDSQIVTDKVWHELAFGLESVGCAPELMRLKVAEMASYFGIQDWFHRDISTLSGGQKQLLNLASIMAMGPEVLILDEPTSQLDPIAASDFLGTVRKINRELGTTILITEHRLEDIFHAADRCIVLEKGRIIAMDTPHCVGKFLHEQQSPMFAAMPAPVRIYYGSGEKDASPLTVRDGRTWLEEKTRGMTIHNNLPEESPYKEPSQPLLQFKNVWQRYKKDSPDILKDTSFSVPAQCLYAIVGGNGTGKSTTLKSICGICKPYRGKILYHGRPIEKEKDLFHGNIALLPQDPQSLFVKQTVLEDLREMVSGTTKEAEELISKTASLCQIDELLQQHPYDLSGGELQRAALAKVLLTKPALLLLDEPTKGLDNCFKNKLSAILKSLIQEGMTIIMVSHDVEFCAMTADYVSMFFDGQVLTTNTPRRFFAQNNFYTTAANRMARGVFPSAVTAENVIRLLKENGL